MNKLRRKALNNLQGKVAELQSDLEILRDEEQEYVDNMPESLQGGERASVAESAVAEMDTAIDSLEEATSSLIEAEA